MPVARYIPPPEPRQSEIPPQRPVKPQRPVIPDPPAPPEQPAIPVAPEAPATKQITATELAPVIGATEAEATRLLDVAKERVERDAPGAPQAVKNEAIIRLAGYLQQSDFGGIRKESIGPLDVEWITNHANAWRASGAGALLAPWKVRRAGAIG